MLGGEADEGLVGAVGVRWEAGTEAGLVSLPVCCSPGRGNYLPNVRQLLILQLGGHVQLSGPSAGNLDPVSSLPPAS